MSIANDRRYIRGQRCPICGGADSDARGAGKRCWGFLSDDGDWAHCSREELAGPLTRSPSNTYGHRLAGSCACGNAHAKPIEERAPRAVDIGPVVAEYNYYDESGVLLYQVRRHEPKTFRQWRPDGSGGWIGKLDPPGGAKTRRVLYRLDRVMEADPETIIWLCYVEDTEVLTPSGWVRFSDLPGDAIVAQWEPSGNISFVAPSARQLFPYDGEIIDIKSDFCALSVTPDHRQPISYKNRDGSQRAMQVRHASDLRYALDLPTSGVMNGSGGPSISEARLLTAWLADGCDEKRGFKVYWNLKKERKKTRLRSLLNELGVSYEERVVPSCQEWTSFHLYRSEIERILRWAPYKQWEWNVLSWPLETRQAIIDETQFWDGDAHGNNSIRFFTSIKQSADVVLAIAVTSGWSGILRIDDRTATRPRSSVSYVVNLKRTKWRTLHKTPTRSTYVGNVYCLTVPSGFLVVRRHGKVTISGNCEGEKDVHAMELIGLTATCGPMGAGKFHMVVDCAKKHLKGRHVVVIADDDSKAKEPADRTKGIDHARDVAKRLKDVAATVRVIEKPTRGHDAASWIEAGGTSEEFLAAVPAIEPAKPPSPDEFVYEHGKPIDSQANIKLALRKLGVTIRFDAFGDREVIDGVEMDDVAYNKLRMTIDEKFDLRIGKEFFYDMISNHARDNIYNPVVDYLAKVRWDGKRRNCRWLTTYAGASDTPYTRAVGEIVLIAAVRRARQPGCKFDEMLILEGEQGKNKSAALRILAKNPEWFCDDLPLGADTKKIMEQIRGIWIVEAPELVGLSKADVNALKSMVARQIDMTRMAYGRKRVSRLRQFILIGTTNEMDDYLRDRTGARRFWPVSIVEFDLEALRRDVDQLWAEAAHAESAGASIRLDPSLYGAAAIEQEARRAHDAIEIQLASALGDYTGRIPTVEVWRILGIDNRPLTSDEMSRLGSAMRKIGWERERFMENGANGYAYAKGVADERKRWLTVSGLGSKARVETRGGGEF